MPEVPVQESAKTQYIAASPETPEQAPQPIAPVPETMQINQNAQSDNSEKRSDWLSRMESQ